MINDSLVHTVLTCMHVLTPEELSTTHNLCKVVSEEVTKKLKSPEYETENAVLDACAALVYYKFMLLEGLKSENIVSFKAGDIQVTEDYEMSLKNATLYRDNALSDASPYLVDVDFIFKSV